MSSTQERPVAARPPVNHRHIFFRPTLNYSNPGLWLAKFLCVMLYGPFADVGPNSDRDPEKNWDLGQNNDYWLWTKVDNDGQVFYHFATRYGLYDDEYEAIRTLLVRRAYCVLLPDDPTRVPPRAADVG